MAVNHQHYKLAGIVCRPFVPYVHILGELHADERKSSRLAGQVCMITCALTPRLVDGEDIQTRWTWHVGHLRAPFVR